MTSRSRSKRRCRQTDSKTFWRTYHWPILGLLGFLSLALGYIGFNRYFDALGTPRPSLSLLYMSLQLIAMEFGNVQDPIPWQLEIARLLTPAVVAYTVWQAAAVIFSEQIDLLKLRFMRDHTVICGLGRKGLLLAKAFHERCEPVVVIEQDPHSANLEQAREFGALILIGNATDPNLLIKARIGVAKQIIGLCGEDGANAEIAVQAHALIRQSAYHKLFTGLFHIYNPRLCELLRGLELTSQDQDRFRLEFFNIYERGACAMLDEYPPFPYQPATPAFIPHIALVGYGHMGESVFSQLLRRWQRLRTSSDQRLRIVLIDQEAERWLSTLQQRDEALDELCELTAYPWPTDALESVPAGLLLTSIANAGVSWIYVCLEADAQSLSAALALRHQLRSQPVPIVVVMSYQGGLTSLLDSTDRQNIDNLAAFPLLDRTCQPERLLAGTHEILARAIHEDYRRQQAALGQTAETNPSMVPWELLPETLRFSNYSQADHIGVKLRAIGCDIIPTPGWRIETLTLEQAEIEQLAELEHERWVEEREDDGWRYGPGPKNIALKTSPYLVPWNQLAEEIKDYDRNNVRDLPDFLAEAGFQIYRLPTFKRSNNCNQCHECRSNVQG